MDDELRSRIAKWLEYYVDITDCRYGYGSDRVIKQSIKILVSKGIFTKEELKRDALIHGEFILTDEFIDTCLN